MKKNILCLAPLAGVTNLPVREFFSGLGADLTHTEMISCSGLVRDNAKTLDMLKVSPRESPVILQLFAPSADVLISGGERALKNNYNYFGLGINMACPMPKITRGGSGAALLKKPDVASEMVKGLKTLGLPVWVKIRKLENDNDTLKFIDVLASAGADNICVHGRTCAQRYEGSADKNILKLAAKNFPDLISASGDVKTLDDIHEYFSFGCVAVMLARGIIANPFLFCEFHGKFFTHDEKINALINFADRAQKFSGEHRALVSLKRFAGSVLRFSEGSAELRNRAMMLQTLNELKKILQERKREG